MQTTDLRQNLSETLDRLASDREPVEIRRHDHPVAVLLPSPGLPPGKKKPVLDLDAVASLCRRRSIKSFALFGSVLRDDFDESSDVDVLIDLGNRHVTFREECDLLDELEAMLGRRVDLIERKMLPQINPRRRSSIEDSAKVIYEVA